MRVREMMRDSLATVGPDAPFATLVAAHRRRDSRLVYVVDDETRLLGVVSCADLLRCAMPFFVDANLAKALPEDASVICQGFGACAGKTAAEVMVREVVSVAPDETLFAAEALFAEGKFHALPVVDAAGRVVGEITRRRILDYLAGFCGL
ncbi:CBS domain-containing protein [Desulfovibrio sp. TomC]|uniref:CBS domain-containing protein n=1 Tax=Desulfovibrio sp. TomC TaxID=1562888 RepID=UPI00057397E6|nr:CBS domain-containing protein [Desulfovibrio sp. TomC]KHK02584.1 CBS domain containing membrane protein [Desulfovibrio sp. TomC]